LYVEDEEDDEEEECGGEYGECEGDYDDMLLAWFNLGKEGLVSK